MNENDRAQNKLTVGGSAMINNGNGSMWEKLAKDKERRTKLQAKPGNYSTPKAAIIQSIFHSMPVTPSDVEIDDAKFKPLSGPLQDAITALADNDEESSWASARKSLKSTANRSLFHPMADNLWSPALVRP